MMNQFLQNQTPIQIIELDKVNKGTPLPGLFLLELLELVSGQQRDLQARVRAGKFVLSFFSPESKKSFKLLINHLIPVFRIHYNYCEFSTFTHKIIVYRKTGFKHYLKVYGVQIEIFIRYGSKKIINAYR